jgi:hypothetical protein
MFVNESGRYEQMWYRQFLFLIGQFKKNLLLWNRFAKLTETWWEAPMEGSLKNCSYRPDLLTIRNKNCQWRPCLLTDRNEMSNLYRGLPIHASYQVSGNLAKRFQRRIFFLVNLLKIFFSKTTWPNEPKLGRKHLWKVLYKVLISSRFVYKHGHHRQFLFLIGQLQRKQI